MIIDTHTHVRLPIEGYEGDGLNIYGVKGDSQHDYLKGFEQNGIDACFVFPIEGFRQDSVIRAENEAMARFQAEYPDRIYGWATVNPSWPEKKLRAEIQYAILKLKLAGLKFVNICQGVSLANRGMDIVADESIRLNIPVFLHDGSPEYSSAIQTAYYSRKFPELRLVSGHGGLRELWPDLLDAVRELPNLHVCLSGPTQWGIQKLYDALGPEKLMFGSDGGLGHPAVTTAYLRRIRHLNAPESDKQLILGINATRFLRIDRSRLNCGSEPNECATISHEQLTKTPTIRGTIV